MVRNAAVLVAVLVCAASAQAAQLVHLYEFKGNANDSIGSRALINNGATIGSSSLRFAANQGPTLNAEASLAGNYSIGMRLSLDTVNGWRKLIDYEGLGSDRGNYTSVLKTSNPPEFPPHLQFITRSGFYNGGTPIAAGATMDVVFTRNGTTGEFAAYLNGSSTPEYTFDDHINNDAVAKLVGGAAQFRFLTDDTDTVTESSPGVLYQLRVWDGALTAAEIPDAFAAIPEPGMVSIALIGLIIPLAQRVRQRS